MISGLLALAWWWLIVSLLGLAIRPAVQLLFKDWPTTGFCLTRYLGVLASGYCVWLLASLHILPFGWLGAWLCVLGVGVACYAAVLRRRPRFSDLIPEATSEIRWQELVFAGSLLFFGFFRMFGPEITGTEKIPDLSFLTSIVRSEWFPPLDVWFSGTTINYFYYGHYLVGFLTTLSGLPPAWGYNLGFCMIYALACSAAYGVVYEMSRNRTAGNLSVLLVMIIGNLDTLKQLVIGLAGGSKLWPPEWFNWWLASRVLVREGLDVTINEFPFWSFILGDMHAHVLALPLTLTVLALGWFHYQSEHAPGLKSLSMRVLFTGLVLGAVPASNTWDTPTAFAIITVAMLMGFLRSKGFTVSSLLALGREALPTYLMAGLMYAPFHAAFAPVGTQGLGIVPSDQRSPVGLFLLIHGLFLYTVLAYFLVKLAPQWSALSKERRMLVGMGLTILVVGAAVSLSVVIGLLLLVMVLGIMVLSRRNLEDLPRYVVVLVILAMGLLLFTELFYIKDTYGPELRRQNTIFKVYYQVWILLAVASAALMSWLKENHQASPVSAYLQWPVVSKFLLGAGLLFPVLSLSVRYSDWSLLKDKTKSALVGMDGSMFLKVYHPGDYNAVSWLNANTGDERPVVLEATGEAFTEYARISAFTGLPTVLGWANHQSIWRDPTWQSCLKRTQDIETIYKTTDEQEALRLLAQYEVTYIFVGRLERTRYQQANLTPGEISGLDKFKNFAKVVSSSHDGTLYQIEQRRLP